MHHKQYGTICEVVPDRLMANILWLKNPDIDIPLEAIIATHSRDLFIDQKIWERFYKVLYNLRQQGKTDDIRISNLFYHKNIEYTLREFDESEINRITEDFVLDTLEEAAKLPEEELKTEIARKEQELMMLLKNEVKKTEIEKDEEWLCRFQKIRSNVRKNAERNASIIVWIIRSLCALLFLIPTLALLIQGKFSVLLKASAITSLAVIGVGIIIGSVPKIWKKLKEIITERIYHRRINKWEINHIESVDEKQFPPS